MKNNVILDKNSTIDITSGEVVEQEVITNVLVGKEPNFYKVYINDIGNLMQLNNGQKNVFELLCANMSFNNIVVLIKPIKKILADNTGFTQNTITKIIDQLYKKNMLIREEKSVYRVNPMYVAKGNWADIKALRLSIEYNVQGRIIDIEKVTDKVITLRENNAKEGIKASEEREQLKFPWVGDVESEKI